jgi:toxin ParE1/3/4
VALERRRLPQAELDLDEIWSYVAKDNPEAAGRVIDRIEAAEVRLSLYPHLGRARDELRAGVRSWTVGSYLIFYNVEPRALVTMRILHGARDLKMALDP